MLSSSSKSNNAVASTSSSSSNNANPPARAVSQTALKVFAPSAGSRNRDNDIINAFCKGELGDYDTFVKLLREHCDPATAGSILKNDCVVVRSDSPDAVVKAFINGKLGDYQTFVNRVTYGLHVSFIESILNHPQLVNLSYKDNKTLLEYCLDECARFRDVLPPNHFYPIMVKILVKQHATKPAMTSSSTSASSASSTASSLPPMPLPHSSLPLSRLTPLPIAIASSASSTNPTAASTSSSSNSNASSSLLIPAVRLPSPPTIAVPPKIRKILKRGDLAEIRKGFLHGTLGVYPEFPQYVKSVCDSALAEVILNTNLIFKYRSPEEVVRSFNEGKLGDYHTFVTRVLVTEDTSFAKAVIKNPLLDTSIEYLNGKTLLDYLSAHHASVGDKILNGKFREAIINVLTKKHPRASVVISSSASSSIASNSSSSLPPFPPLPMSSLPIAVPSSVASSAAASSASSFLSPPPPLPMPSLPIAASSSVASSAVKTVCSLVRKKYFGKEIFHLDENSTEQDIKLEARAPIVHEGTNPELLKKVGENLLAWCFCCATNKEISAIPSILRSYAFCPGMGMTIDSVKSIHSHFDRVILNAFTNPVVLHALPPHVKEARVYGGVTLKMLNALPDHVVIKEISGQAYNAILVSTVNERARRINAAGKETHPIFADQIPQSDIFIKPLPLNAPHDAASTSLSALLPPPKISSSTSTSTSTTASTSSIQTLLSHNENGNDNAAANSRKRNATALSASTISSISSHISSSLSDIDAQRSKRAKTIDSIGSFFNDTAAKATELAAECKKMNTVARLLGLRGLRCVNQTDIVSLEKELESLGSIESTEHIDDPITWERLTDPVDIGTGHVYNRKTLLDVKTDAEGKKKCPMTTKVFTDNDIVSLPKEIFAKSIKFYDHVVAQSKARLEVLQKKSAELDEQINELERGDEVLSSSSSSVALTKIPF